MPLSESRKPAESVPSPTDDRVRGSPAPRLEDTCKIRSLHTPTRIKVRLWEDVRRAREASECPRRKHIANRTKTRWRMLPVDREDWRHEAMEEMGKPLHYDGGSEASEMEDRRGLTNFRRRMGTTTQRKRINIQKAITKKTLQYEQQIGKKLP